MVVFRKSILAGIIVSIHAYNYLLNYDTLSKIVFSLCIVSNFSNEFKFVYK